ncbi:MAG: polysaccharide biosynthesis/export family protein [Lacunisphaera sp.]
MPSITLSLSKGILRLPPLTQRVRKSLALALRATAGSVLALAAFGGVPGFAGDLAPAGAGQAEYILQPMDLVKIEVFQEPDMERQVRITQDSSITLPLINKVDLKGRTVQQAQEVIRELYDKDYLVNPQINLTVMEYAKRDVKVLGQVGKPGAVDIPTDRPLKLLDAIALAEGFTRLADRKRVTLTRTDASGKTTTTEINADSIIQSRNSADQWTLQQGDVINVPERLL